MSKGKWIENLPEEIYHADTATVGSSQLRRILKSPAYFKAHLDPAHAETTDAMRFGALAHRIILGQDVMSDYVVMPNFTATHGHANSNIHKQAKAEWLAEHEGKKVVSQSDRDDIMGIMDSILNHNDARTLFARGIAEVSGFYTDPETGIACRIRLDIFSPDLMAVVDPKTTIDCSENAFAKSIWNYRYDFQLGMYGEGTQIITGKKVDYHAFIAIEKKKPYDVAVYVADGAMIDRGVDDYHKALKLLAKCRKHNEYPAYQQTMQNISLPSWVMNQI